jgi:hypothetical protein
MSRVLKNDIIQHILWKCIQQGKIKVHFKLKNEIKTHLGDLGESEKLILN